jgi:hypothetical protein
MIDTSAKTKKMKLPPKLQVSKMHQTLIIRALFLVRFGVFVIWWLNLNFWRELIIHISKQGI